MRSLFVAGVFCALAGAFVKFTVASHLCNPAIYRCIGNQVAFRYNRKSDCQPTRNGLDCSNARTRCICLNVEKVCLKTLPFADLLNPLHPFNIALAAEAQATATNGTTTSAGPTTVTTTAPTTTATSANATGALDAAAENQRPRDPCVFPFPGDFQACDSHRWCDAMAGGLALCCSGRCLTVHNVPCVRNFFKKEDQLCDDRRYKALFSAAAVEDSDE